MSHKKVILGRAAEGNTVKIAETKHGITLTMGAKVMSDTEKIEMALKLKNQIGHVINRARAIQNENLAEKNSLGCLHTLAVFLPDLLKIAREAETLHAETGFYIWQWAHEDILRIYEKLYAANENNAHKKTELRKIIKMMIKMEVLADEINAHLKTRQKKKNKKEVTKK